MLSAGTAANLLKTDKPDIVVFLGDRYEIFAAAGAATINNIPIAHIHGGETTLGSFDDSLRNAISMLASVHFVSAQEYGDKLSSMGLSNIHVVGAPGLDNINDVRKQKKTKRIVVTFHPPTRTQESVQPLLSGLEKYPDYEIIFTGVNNDPGNDTVESAIKEFARVRRNITLNETMDTLEYLSLCSGAMTVVGNSSSGLIEIPSVETSTVDIGERQNGRLRGPSVFHANNNETSIGSAIKSAIEYGGPFSNPHVGPGASDKIAKILEDQYIRRTIH